MRLTPLPDRGTGPICGQCVFTFATRACSPNSATTSSGRALPCANWTRRRSRQLDPTRQALNKPGAKSKRTLQSGASSTQTLRPSPLTSRDAQIRREQHQESALAATSLHSLRSNTEAGGSVHRETCRHSPAHFTAALDGVGVEPLVDRPEAADWTAAEMSDRLAVCTRFEGGRRHRSIYQLGCGTIDVGLWRLPLAEQLLGLLVGDGAGDDRIRRYIHDDNQTSDCANQTVRNRVTFALPVLSGR